MIEFWISLVLATVFAYPIFRLLLRLNSRQKVSEFAPESHQAKQGTPTMGGLMIIVPLCVGLACWRESTSGPPEITRWPGLPCIVLVLLFAAIGFVDDYVVPRVLTGKRGLGWKQKLVLQFLAALGYGFIVGHAGEQLALDVLLIVACSNAYNFADGLDGLAASIALLLIPGLIVLSAAVSAHDSVEFLVALAGAMLPFVFLNAPKAKVFMGDVGSLPVGALVGAVVALPVARGADWHILLATVVLCLVLLAELLPVPLQILWVKVFKRRLFPFTPIHHAFEKSGWPETRVVALFAMAQLICTMGCITLASGLLDTVQMDIWGGR